jgi:predicted alpha/beta hydrolase
MLNMWTHALELTKEKGYFPPEASVFKITLPFGIGMEWSSRIAGDDKRYFAGDPDLSSFYTSWKPTKEVISVAFNDDIILFSTPGPIDEWCELLPQAKMTRIIVSPDNYGWTPVGHIGMFKEGQEGVWELIRDIISDGKLPTRGDIRRWNQGKAKL